jgi:hypothetical protein
MYATKTYAVNFTAVAAGDGYWSMAAGQRVTFNEISVSISDYSGDCEFTASLNAEHDADARTCGLCYTDSGIESALNAFIAQHAELSKLIASVDGSEQGMQERTTFNCDVELQDDVSFEMLRSMGFDVECDEDIAFG